MPSTSSRISSLSTDLFYEAVKNYSDYNRPDPIAKRQLEKWKLVWTNIGQIIDDRSEFAEYPTTNIIQGTLEICGDYVAVTIKTKCVWTGKHAQSTTRNGDKNTSSSNNNSNNSEDGRLSYQVEVVSARFIERNNDSEQKESKAEKKIRTKMISRLRQDSYIAKLVELPLQQSNKEQNTNTETKDPTKQKSNKATICLAEANIYVHTEKSELEERVDISETVAEALRRALWSSTKSSLDIVEVILALPSLPCHNCANNCTTTTTTTQSTTRLANRCKLRLLEDAMLDECEKEGEDQLIEDLSISTTTSGAATLAASRSSSKEPDKSEERKESRRKKEKIQKIRRQGMKWTTFAVVIFPYDESNQR
mmetsp:Transcript_58486/g.63138  ORF Transcript_58486/g.63138 Transcript_58486/m.63138 type:complete len:365 (-) Transcript_58486:140-1234(-)